jgi:hypothetical protein
MRSTPAMDEYIDMHRTMPGLPDAALRRRRRHQPAGRGARQQRRHRRTVRSDTRPQASAGRGSGGSTFALTMAVRWPTLWSRRAFRYQVGRRRADPRGGQGHHPRVPLPQIELASDAQPEPRARLQLQECRLRRRGRSGTERSTRQPRTMCTRRRARTARRPWRGGTTPGHPAAKRRGRRPAASAPRRTLRRKQA